MVMNVKVAIFLVANVWMTTLISAQNPACDICNGGTLQNPNEPIDVSLLPPDLASQIPPGVTLTCGLIAQAATSGLIPATECTLIQGGISLFCNCGGATPV